MVIVSERPVVGRGVFVRRVNVAQDGELSWFEPSGKPVLVANRKKGQHGEGRYVVVGPDGGFYEF